MATYSPNWLAEEATWVKTESTALTDNLRKKKRREENVLLNTQSNVRESTIGNKQI